MNREELKKFIEDVKSKIKKIDVISYYIKWNYKLEYQEIINETNYLSKDCKFTERLYHIINDLFESQKCGCENNVHFISIIKGYHKFCSLKCKSNNKEIRIKTEKTSLKRFGVKCCFENENIKQQIKKTNLEIYGVENVFQSEKIKEISKQTKKEKYNNENYKNIKKAKKSRFIAEYNKLLNSNRLKGLVIPLFTVNEYVGVCDEKGKAIYYPFKCKNCRSEFKDDIDNGGFPRCYICNPKKNRFTIPHQIITTLLKKNNIIHEIEKHIYPYYCDIFIELNKIIEVYGDYWHANPKKYLSETIMNYPNNSMKAKDRWEYDKNRINYLKNNYEVLIIWQDEINNNFEEVKKRTLEFVNK